MIAPQSNHQKGKRKGQTLAEFAVTLPILLLLVFGIIEFGRVFQAWVTLNNAARTAARYASTGQFNETKYVVNDGLEEDPDSIVDCVISEDLRGTLANRTVASGDTVQVYDGREGLFATWYDGLDCDPRDGIHQEMRKDIARILSITDEARRGAAGLTLGPDPLAGVTTEAGVRDFLYDVWERPLPGGGDFRFRTGSDQPSFFDVVICSGRGMRNPDFATAYSSDEVTRFIPVFDTTDMTDDPDGRANLAPLCLLNEQPEAIGGSTQNEGIPWLDAGGPNNVVSIVITFNHPLITPLGLEPYLPLQARRAAVVEAFRPPDAESALLGAGSIVPDINIAPRAVAEVTNPGVIQDGNTWTIVVGVGDTQARVFLSGLGSEDTDGTIEEYQWYMFDPGTGNRIDLIDPGTGAPDLRRDPVGWDLPLGTHEISLTVVDNEGADDDWTLTVIITGPNPTATPTGTTEPLPTATDIQPFSCDLISAGEVSFFNNRVFIQFTNNNVLATVMTRAEFYWPTLTLFPNMNVSGLALDGTLHWRGSDYSPPTDTNADPSDPADLFVSADRRVPGGSTAAWEAVFVNGPSPIQDPFAGIFHMTQHDFDGTTFTFQNPEGGSCVISLELPTATPVAPGRQSPTPVPNCDSAQMRWSFGSFEPFGVVRLSMVNLLNTPVELTDFSIDWVANGQMLEWVSVGGSSSTDRISGVVVWQATSGQDVNPPTVGGSTGASTGAVNNSNTGATGREGTWLTNYTFPADSVTNLWIKYGVTNSPPDTAFNMFASHLNDSWFQFNCPATGDTGRVDIIQEPSPFPSNTPGPSDTPRPTFTPSDTPTTGPPTDTPPPATITNTSQPTDTPAPTATNTRVPPGGGGDTGGVDG